MKKSKSKSTRSTYTPNPQLICEVQSVLRGRIFRGNVPPLQHGLEEQKGWMLLFLTLYKFRSEKMDNFATQV